MEEGKPEQHMNTPIIPFISAALWEASKRRASNCEAISTQDQFNGGHIIVRDYVDAIFTRSFRLPSHTKGIS